MPKDQYEKQTGKEISNQKNSGYKRAKNEETLMNNDVTQTNENGDNTAVLGNETNIVNNFDNTYQHLTMNTLGNTLPDNSAIKGLNHTRTDSGTIEDGTEKLTGSQDGELKLKG